MAVVIVDISEVVHICVESLMRLHRAYTKNLGPCNVPFTTELPVPHVSLFHCPVWPYSTALQCAIHIHRFLQEERLCLWVARFLYGIRPMGIIHHSSKFHDLPPIEGNMQS